MIHLFIYIVSTVWAAWGVYKISALANDYPPFIIALLSIFSPVLNTLVAIGTTVVIIAEKTITCDEKKRTERVLKKIFERKTNE